MYFAVFLSALLQWHHATRDAKATSTIKAAMMTRIATVFIGSPPLLSSLSLESVVSRVEVPKRPGEATIVNLCSVVINLVNSYVNIHEYL